MDWQRLYQSRIWRIMPMYLFSVMLMLGVAFFTQHATVAHHFREIVWYFWLFRSNDLGATYPDVSLIDAGVTWTLPYEWFFYFSLPVLAVFLNQTPVKRRYELFIYAALIFDGYLTVWKLDLYYLILFVYGVFSFELTIISRFSILRHAVSGWKGGVLIVLLSVVLIHHYETAYVTGASFLYALIFVVITQGNNVFGLLETTAAKMLDDVSYSIYLLHGIVLYCFFYVFRSKTLSGHWAIAASAILCTILLSKVTYLKIEKKFMSSSTPCASEFVPPAHGN